jgi:choline dehydrogenase-like flavoprotein
MVAEADVVIAGAGAAGSLHAAEFAAVGRKVVMLEAGPA